MKVALCQINSKYVHSPLAPWCLAAGLKAYGKCSVCCKVVEGTINENPDEIVRKIAEEKPDVIGLSCYIWNISVVEYVGKALKSLLPDTKIVLGGPEISYNQCEALSLYSFCDYLISGEGEKPFATLCDCLSQNILYPDLPGVSYRKKDEFILKEPFIDHEDPPSPYTQEYFDALHGRICYLETSRGCPYRCAFCLSGRCGGARFFDYDRSVKDALALANSGSQTIKLVDRTFNANKKRAKDFWKFLIEENGKSIPKGVCFHFEIAGDILDEESLEILSHAPKGAIQLEIGLQSFNEQTLEYINRKTNTERLRQNILRLISFRNMHVHIDLIAGLPYEDLKSFQQSFDIAYRLYPDMLQLGFLKLLHGADMREDKNRYPCEFHKEAPYEVIKTPWTDEKALSSLHATEDALERLYNSGRFKNTVFYLIEELGKDPFEVYDGFGSWVQSRKDYTVDLDTYTELIFEYFSNLPDVNPARLKDRMILDRLTTNAGGKLPDFLKLKRDILRKVRVRTEENPMYAQKKGVKRSFALLGENNTALLVDYTGKDPITGVFAPVFLSYDEEYNVTEVPYESL